MAKVKVTTWVDERTAGVLRALAAQEGSSVSEVAARQLREAVEGRAAEGIGSELLIPEVRSAVRREMAKMSERLSRLLVRGALESAAGRRAAYQLLVSEFGEEEARRMNRAAWNGSVESLKKPAEGLREILAGHDGAAEAGANAAAEEGRGS